VEIDFTKAFEYFKRAANLGNEQAQRSLAFLLDTGKGTPIDKAQVQIPHITTS
jgi:TPR repeat protein